MDCHSVWSKRNQKNKKLTVEDIAGKRLVKEKILLEEARRRRRSARKRGKNVGCPITIDVY